MPGGYEDPENGILQNMLDKISSGEPRLSWIRDAPYRFIFLSLACVSQASSVTSAVQDAACGYEDFCTSFRHLSVGNMARQSRERAREREREREKERA